MNDSDELTSEDLELIELEFAKIIQRSCSILLVGLSRVKCQTDLNTLKAAGFFNISIETKLTALPSLLKKKKIRVVVMDGDMKGNESLKLFLNLKSNKNITLPEFLFIREDISANTIDIFNKSGALGCLHKPLLALEFEDAIKSILFDEEEVVKEFSIESKPFGESTLIKLKGELQKAGLNELLEKLTEVQFEENDGCLIDFSKVKYVDNAIVTLFKNSAETFKSAEKNIDVFDPKNKLSKFNLEKIINFI